MSDEALIQELRDMGEHPSRADLPMGRTLRDAADRIEQLEREKAAMYDLWEQQKEIVLGYLTDCDKAAERIEALLAENARLRAVSEFYLAKLAKIMEHTRMPNIALQETER